jgi:hypothetical protein
MLQKSKRILIVTIFVAALLASLLAQLYFVSDHAGATLFQRGDEAYLFLGAGHTGSHFPALAYPLVIAKAYLRVPVEASDVFGQFLVIRVTPSGVQRWVEDVRKDKPNGVALLTPFEDGFYARCPGTVLCKWTGNSFDPVSAEEEKRIGIGNLYIGSFDNKVVNGWTAHVLRFAPGDHFEVQLAKDFVIAVRNYSERDWAHPSVTVDVLRPGKAPENLYRVDGRPRLVSKSEYKQVFGKR